MFFNLSMGKSKEWPLFIGQRAIRLEKIGHTEGLSCDEDGPALGPIRFLKRTPEGLVSRPIEELNATFGWAFGEPVSCSRLMPGLGTIAKALNNGELARAMIATQFLRLSPLNAAQAWRAADAVALFKAAVDDPEHPGWPAGTPDSRGGEFRPKDASLEDFEQLQMPELPDARRAVMTRLEQKAIRAAIRTALRRILTFKRIVRLLGETASNVVPGLDALGDAAMVHDVAEMAGEMIELRQQAIVARAFVEHGPYSLDELRVSTRNLSFSSFNEFKKADIEKYFPNAGLGSEFHHIIPQASGLRPTVLNSTKNVIQLPTLIHQMVSDRWASLARQEGKTLSQYLDGMTYSEQRQVGLKILRELGILESEFDQ
jgi:hypothetical protein